MRFNNNVETKTHEWWVAYVLSAKQELIKLCLISFIQNDFYTKYEDKIKRIQEYTTKVSVEFIKNLSIWSRDYWLRTVNHILFVEWLLKLIWTKWSRSIIKQWITSLVRRPDELIDIVWYFAYRDKQNLNSIKLPNLLKYAIKERLQLFNDYQIAKYKWSWDLNLFDLINMVHAKSESIDKLMKWTLKPADTWEVELSKNGNTKESWDRLLKENKLWALATIRNLRNMSKVWVDFKEYLKTLDFTKVFPFQSIQALDILETDNLLTDDIYNIIMSKVKDSFKFISESYSWKIAIWIDLSGSMYGTKVSNLSRIDRARMATYYWVLLAELFEQSDIYLWWSACEQINKEMSIQDILRRWKGWTNIHTLTDAVKWKWYDYLIVLTDEQTRSSIPAVNVANKQTIVWWLHDYANTISDWKGIVYFTGYNDIMWKIWADIMKLWELEKQIAW